MAVQLLLPESPVILIPSLAQLIGLNEALLVQQIYFWQHNPIKFPDESEIYLKHIEGATWVRIEPKMFLHSEWGRLRFLSERTWKRAVQSSKEMGILQTRNLNTKDALDNTNWYRVVVDEIHRRAGLPVVDDGELGAFGPSGQNDPTAGSKRPGGRANTTPASGQSGPSKGPERPQDGAKVARSYTENRENSREVVRDKQHSGETEGQNAVVVEGQNSSVVRFTPEEFEGWVQALVRRRLSREAALRYAGPQVPRVVAWWDDLDKSRLQGLGLLIAALRDPDSRLPAEEEKSSQKDGFTEDEKAERRRAIEAREQLGQEAFEMLPEKEQSMWRDVVHTFQGFYLFMLNKYPEILEKAESEKKKGAP